MQTVRQSDAHNQTITCINTPKCQGSLMWKCKTTCFCVWVATRVCNSNMSLCMGSNTFLCVNSNTCLCMDTVMEASMPYCTTFFHQFQRKESLFKESLCIEKQHVNTLMHVSFLQTCKTKKWVYMFLLASASVPYCKTIFYQFRVNGLPSSVDIVWVCTHGWHCNTCRKNTLLRKQVTPFLFSRQTMHAFLLWKARKPFFFVKARNSFDVQGLRWSPIRNTLFLLKPLFFKQHNDWHSQVTFFQVKPWCAMPSGFLSSKALSFNCK